MTLTPHWRLIIFIILAFMINYLPVINLPFLWSQTFFHEISHGIAALLTGGSIHNISLHFSGSGLCVTSGGISAVVAFSGYAGSALGGLLIYRLADSLSPASSRVMVFIMVGMLALTLLLWARDLSTIIILLVLLLMYGLPLYQSLWISVKSFIQLVGIFVILEAIRSPLYLLDGRDIGDGATLAGLLWLPEIFWVGVWFLLAVGCLGYLWKSTSGADHRSVYVT